MFAALVVSQGIGPTVIKQRLPPLKGANTDRQGSGFITGLVCALPGPLFDEPPPGLRQAQSARSPELIHAAYRLDLGRHLVTLPGREREYLGGDPLGCGHFGKRRMNGRRQPQLARRPGHKLRIVDARHQPTNPGPHRRRRSPARVLVRV